MPAPCLTAVAREAAALPPIAPLPPKTQAAAAAPAAPPSPSPSPPPPPFAQGEAPVLPRSPEDIVHNLAVRQLVEDAENPPVDEESPELRVLETLVQARSAGKGFDAEIKAEAGRLLAGGESMDRLAWHLYRRHQTKKLVDWLQADDRADRFLLRLYRRGDLTASEALVMKKLSSSRVKEMAEELLQGLRDGYPEANPEEMFHSLALTAQVTTKTQTLLHKTTPQGREIVRKLIFTARQRIKTAK